MHVNFCRIGSVFDHMEEVKTRITHRSAMQFWLKRTARVGCPPLNLRHVS